MNRRRPAQPTQHDAASCYDCQTANAQTPHQASPQPPQPTVDEQATVVGRYVRRAERTYLMAAPTAYAVERYRADAPPLGTYEAWRLVAVYGHGAHHERRIIVDACHGSAAAANEIAAWYAIKDGFIWDRASFPSGLVRETAQ